MWNTCHLNSSHAPCLLQHSSYVAVCWQLKWSFEPGVTLLLLFIAQFTLRPFPLINLNCYFLTFIIKLICFCLASSSYILLKRDSSTFFFFLVWGDKTTFFEAILPGFNSWLHHLWFLSPWASAWYLSLHGHLLWSTKTTKGMHVDETSAWCI